MRKLYMPKSPNTSLQKPGRMETFAAIGLSVVFLSLAALFEVYAYFLNKTPFSVVTVTKISSEAVALEIKTDFPMKTKVQYGTSELYLNETEMSPELKTTDKKVVWGLLPNRPHYFRLIGETKGGKVFASKFYTD